MKIIFVCTGNTCRSPMAEKLLKHKLKAIGKKGISVHSCGLMPVEGSFTEDKAVEALKTVGVSARKKRAENLDFKKASEADFLIGMTVGHKSSMQRAGLSHACTLGELTGFGDVSDPYGCGQEIYNLTALQLSTLLDVFVEKYL